MINILSIKKNIFIVFSFVLAIFLVTGCSDDLSIRDKEKDIDKSKIAAMHGDLFIRDIDIKNIKDFQIYVVHYNDGKLIKKQPLITSDEKDKELHNFNILLSLSVDFKNTRKFESYFFNGGAVGTSDFYFKHKIDLSTEELKSYYPEFTSDKSIILGGLYLEDSANKEIKTLETLAKTECILFMLEKSN